MIFESLLDFNPPSIFFEVLLHLGTLLAIVAVFYADLVRIFSSPFKWAASRFKPLESETAKADLRFFFFIVLASAATAIIGFAFKERVEQAFESVKLVGFMLLVTGFILLMSKINENRQRKSVKDMSPLEALLIGVAQAVAIIPGISRSGSTISLGLIQKLDKTLAAKFSFYISIPAIFGATLLKATDITQDQLSNFYELVPGFITSLIVGIFAIKILMKHIARGKFYLYSIYCFAAGLAVLFFLG